MYKKAMKIKHLVCSKIIFETQYIDEEMMKYYRDECLEMGNEEFYCENCKKRCPITELEVSPYTPSQEEPF